MTNSEAIAGQHGEGRRIPQHDRSPTLYARRRDTTSDTVYEHHAWGSDISIAVDPVALITTECITVTSAMRKHARWAHSSVSAILGGGPSISNDSDISRLPRPGNRSIAANRTKAGKGINGAFNEDENLASRWGLRGKKGKSMQDNPLLSAFARLRNDLRGCTGRSHPWSTCAV